MSGKWTMRRVEVGLTGGIACGKSEAAGILADHGVPVLDTDEVARDLLVKGHPVSKSVVDAFGRGILAPDGSIDRAVLGERVFRDGAERERLNAIVHPAVRTHWGSWLAERRTRGEPGVVVIPLLFEVGATEGWTAVVCVTAREEIVLARLRRRGLSPEQSRLRIAAQMPVAEKAARADIVIENNGTRRELRARVLTMWRTVIEKE
jgi:dephospho-CoA kinase